MVRPNVALLANPEIGVVIRRAHVSQLKPYHYSEYELLYWC